jgi:hypothetical protein
VTERTDVVSEFSGTSHLVNFGFSVVGRIEQRVTKNSKRNHAPENFINCHPHHMGCVTIATSAVLGEKVFIK